MPQRRHLQHLSLKFGNLLTLLLPTIYFSLSLPITVLTTNSHPPFPSKSHLSPHQWRQQHRRQRTYRCRPNLPQPRQDEATKPEESHKLVGLEEILLGLYEIFPAGFRPSEFEDGDEGDGRGEERDDPDAGGLGDSEVEG